MYCLQTSNALRVAAINSVGTFVLLLGKLSVVIATVLIGMQLIKVLIPDWLIFIFFDMIS